jgi:hypothetical protein
MKREQKKLFESGSYRTSSFSVVYPDENRAKKSKNKLWIKSKVNCKVLPCLPLETVAQLYYLVSNEDKGFKNV